MIFYSKIDLKFLIQINYRHKNVTLTQASTPTPASSNTYKSLTIVRAPVPSPPPPQIPPLVWESSLQITLSKEKKLKELNPLIL